MKAKGPEYYDEVFASSETYHAHYKDSPYFVLWTQVINSLKKYSSPKILDIGCGPGQFANYLSDEGFTDYHGFDFSQEAIRRAQKNLPMSFAVGNAENPKSYDEDFNFVVALEVLEHVLDDMAILNNIPEGTDIIFSLPVFRSRSHVRWFNTPEEILSRYYDRIEFSKIIPIDSWFVCVGKVSACRSTFLNRMFLTREPVTFWFLKERIRKKIKQWKRNRRRLKAIKFNKIK